MSLGAREAAREIMATGQLLCNAALGFGLGVSGLGFWVLGRGCWFWGWAFGFSRGQDLGHLV